MSRLHPLHGSDSALRLATLAFLLAMIAASTARFAFAANSGSADDAGIPLASDFAYVVSGQADVGLTFALPNALGSPTDLDRAQSQLFEQRLYLFAQNRL